ncbi:MAG: DUF3800 domain-containing protein [Chloroflexi bacterium]|nr:DUF3800 domain-containing protein [Chloroflexota bacterium]
MSTAASGRRLVFVDWAGDPGFKFREGSSRHLVVVAVFTSQYEDVREALSGLRRKRRLPEGFALHYTSAGRSLRLAIADLLANLSVAVRVVVVDKAALGASWHRMKGWELTERFIADAVVGARQEQLEDALVIVDGARRDTRQLSRIRVALSRLCAQRRPGCHLGRVKARPAAEEDGLQVADAIAGMALEGIVEGRRFSLPAVRGGVDVVMVPGFADE